MEHLVYETEHEQYVATFKTTGTAFTVRFTNMDQVEDYDSFLLAAIDTVLDRITTTPTDRVGLSIQHPGSFVDLFFDITSLIFLIACY